MKELVFNTLSYELKGQGAKDNIQSFTTPLNLQIGQLVMNTNYMYKMFVRNELLLSL